MILKNSLFLATLSFVSLLLGVVRDRLLAHFVGVGAVLDVYNASFRIPDLTYGIVFSFASATTVVPFIVHAVHTKDTKELETRFNSLLFFFAGVLIVLSTLVVLFLPFVAKYIVPGFTGEQVVAFVMYTRILMLQPFLLGISALISTLAQVKHRFVMYAVAPLIYTCCIILGIIFGYPTYGLLGIIVGVVVGALLSLTLQSYTLYKERMKISWEMFNFDRVKDHIRFASPHSGAVVVSRTRDVILTGIATSFGPGALSVYVFAQRVMDAFIQVVVQSSASASLPSLARHHSQGELREYRRVFMINISSIIFLACLATVFCMLVPRHIVTLLYGSGAGTASIASLMVLLSFSLPIYAVNTYLVSAFNASRDSMSLFIANLIASCVAVASVYIARDYGYGIVSLAIGSWVLGVGYLLLLALFYSRKILR